MAKARQIASILDNDLDDTTNDSITEHDESSKPTQDHSSLRIQTRRSPYLDTFYHHHPLRLVVDSGATAGNMIRLSTAQTLGLESSQSAHQADGSSPLQVTGETRFDLFRNNQRFLFEGLVVENLDVSKLAGTPFMETNDIAIRPAKREIAEQLSLMGPATIEPMINMFAVPWSCAPPIHVQPYGPGNS
jgi:hypothetical protein